MNCFYLIDKPLNITSFDVIRKLRKTLNIRRIGHSWTLDPLASWALLVALWNYTKLLPYIEKDSKEYEFTINLDGTSDSYDLWTEVNYLEEEKQKSFKSKLAKSYINNILQEKFTWKISQTPPKYSAIKIWWKKALEKVRKWEDFEMKSREVTIHSIDILDFSYPELKLRAKVSAWTYIRSIAFSLWDLLGTWWYISHLRRTKVWDLDLSLSQKLENFSEEDTLNIKKLFPEENFISLGKADLEKIDNGLTISWDFDYKIWEDLFILNNGYITNIVSYDWNTLKPIRKI